MSQKYIEEQEWRIPPSNEYVSDSESPLSLLPSPKTPSSPVLTPLPETDIKLSYFEEEEEEEREKDSLKQVLTSSHQEHIIASNETIACIRPQSVSIVWSNNQKTTIHLSTEKEASVEPPTIKQQKKRRTTTSYDMQTSLYLKSVFFEVYSKQKKLTKEQRIQIQQKTGLPSRNITYWFSNHKRRFKDTLKVYRQAVEESHGAIENYKDFIHWRRSHDLPDQVTQAEL